MQKQEQLTKGNILDKATIKKMADAMADEMATRFYYKMVMLKFISEIKEIESGKSKALKGKEIDRFLDQVKGSK